MVLNAYSESLLWLLRIIDWSRSREVGCGHATISLQVTASALRCDVANLERNNEKVAVSVGQPLYALFDTRKRIFECVMGNVSNRDAKSISYLNETLFGPPPDVPVLSLSANPSKCIGDKSA